MSPAPDLSNENIKLTSLTTNAVLTGVSSSDELEQLQLDEYTVDLGSLTIDDFESVDLADNNDNGGDETQTESSPAQKTICSAPSTPTGERDAPLVFRRPSISATDNGQLPQIEVKYQGVTNSSSTNSDDNNGLLDSFFGCLKPIFSAVNKLGENIRHHRDTSLTMTTLSKTNDDWNIPTDSIINDLVLIGTGNEGSVYRCKFGGQVVACKRVKSEDHTNIKHLRKLNHTNIIKFRGVSVSPPLFYIVMEYCPYGSLYDVLKSRRERNVFTKPTQVLDWSKQISNGVNYLHSNRIVHRDLKSPNILIAERYILKISDFGTSKQMSNNKSQPMSFNGTSAWMAPEVIRHEPCSEKIDVWAFGIVLWEILTCAVPYQNIDPVAVMWGVCKGSLTLPIPSSAPEGFKLLMNMCWNQRPSNRPSFQLIIKHLNTSEPEIILFEEEQEYSELTRAWSVEINERLANLPAIDISSMLKMSNDELVKKRKEELQHIADIRAHYQQKLKKVDALYIELASLMMQLQKREQQIKKKERELKIQPHTLSNNNNGKKKSLKTIVDARKQSLKLIKNASFHLTDPTMLSNLSKDKIISDYKNIESLTQQPKPAAPHSLNQKDNVKTTTGSPTSIAVIHDPSSAKNSQRRKKSMGHRRNNSKGSVTSWTPPSLSEIAAQETVRRSIGIVNDRAEIMCTNLPYFESEINQTTSRDSPIPSISADIDSKSKSIITRLNPKNLKLDLESPISPKNHERSTPLRKLSSSDPEDVDQETVHNLSKQRRRRPVNLVNSRSTSPTSICSRSNKGSVHDQSTMHAEELPKTENPNDHDKSNDGRKNRRTVSFQHTPTIKHDRSPSFQLRKSFNRSKLYSSSEEGEVEEVHSDYYVLDDKKHRAKHEDVNRTFGLFSSESEVYIETNQHSSSSRNESALSDEGGHVSDDRPASRESLINSEPEHE